MGVSSRGLRAFRRRPASRRQRSDLVTLAHIREQSRVNIGGKASHDVGVKTSQLRMI